MVVMPNSLNRTGLLGASLRAAWAFESTPAAASFHNSPAAGLMYQ